MTDWLAVVAFCLGQECAFWVSNKEPIRNQEQCKKIADAAEQHFIKQGAAFVFSGCVPIRWVRT